MISKRIIPCLDVKDGRVVKGIRFRNHEVLGSALDFAKKYSDDGADELVFYDIMASSENRSVDPKWVSEIAKLIDIPFCVAGGLRDREQVRAILNSGADKVSINSPALENPNLIYTLAREFGSQCIVIGVDTKSVDGEDFVFLYTGDEKKTLKSKKSTWQWLSEIQELGAGEVVFNCMDSDGTGEGYDIKKLCRAREILQIPLIASGGASCKKHFKDVFEIANVDGALAAGAFHRKALEISALKKQLEIDKIKVRIS
jgi:imidazole glycerol-phosphate synthase subunit HisF